jgi:hypothetical protein
MAKTTANKQMAKLHKVCMDCMKYLVIKKGVTIDQAEAMVMETLKESEHYLKAGMVNETIASLKMIHMDESPEKAAQDLIKSLMK